MTNKERKKITNIRDKHKENIEKVMKTNDKKKKKKLILFTIYFLIHEKIQTFEIFQDTFNGDCIRWSKVLFILIYQPFESTWNLYMFSFEKKYYFCLIRNAKYSCLFLINRLLTNRNQKLFNLVSLKQFQYKTVVPSLSNQIYFFLQMPPSQHWIIKNLFEKSYLRVRN